MAAKYILTVRVPGHAPSVTEEWPDQETAVERLTWHKAAAPECIVEIRKLDPAVRKKGRRG